MIQPHKRIWVMAKGFAPDEGGQQTYARKLAEAFADLGAAVTVVTQTSAGPRDEMLGALRVVDIGPGKGADVPLRWLRALRKLRREQGGNPDYCHAATWRTAVPPMLLRMRFGVSLHGREFMYPTGIALALLKAVMRRAKPLVVASRYSLQALSTRLGNGFVQPLQPLVGWYGTDFMPVARQALQADSPVQILTICRLDSRKNVARAVEAVAMLHGEGLALRHVICGRGPESDAIAARIAELGIGDVVTMAGFVTDQQVVDYLGASQIFLHPQIADDDGRNFEGFGLVIADAMRAGCAPVVGREGGSAELVEVGISGHIVGGRDVAEIANALRGILQDRQRCHAMGQAAQQRSVLFDWAAHARAILHGQEGEEVI